MNAIYLGALSYGALFGKQLRIRRTWSRLATVFVAIVLFSSSLPVSAQVLTRQLTLTGPSSVTVGAQNVFKGRLSLDGVGIPFRTVEIRRGNDTLAITETKEDGSYSAAFALVPHGVHELKAISDSASLLETESNIFAVEAVAELIAPADGTTTTTDLYGSTEFLYTGDGLQTGVAPGTIKPKQVAVVRGAISDSSGAELGGVTLSVAGHNEFGETVSTVDGVFDMAVNGGRKLTIRYEKDGFLPVEREISVPWRDYAVLPEVTLTPLDAAVTTVGMGNATMQVARGSSVSDPDGTRRATLLFPSGTQARMTLPGGGEQQLSSIDVRATEYTVGPNGAAAMPGELPPASAYTYAVELSADEALNAGATEVIFNQPVPFYVENFLAMPVGEAVPAGYYDRAAHGWMGSDDGRVLQVVSETAGKADVDIDGDKSPDGSVALSALGITDAEREKLANLYEPGDSLWRVAMTHFTPWDLNWPFGLPAGARAPGQEEAASDGTDSCTQDGSIIGCEAQSLGEAIPLAGTPHHLRYDSTRAVGRAATRSLRIPLTGADLPPGLKLVTLEVAVAGRVFSESFTPSANLIHTFTWDGRDPYGRMVQGRELAAVKIGYVYDGVYWSAGGTIDGASWGASGSNPMVNRARQEITLFQQYSKLLGGFFDVGPSSIGGWSLSSHHVYDPDGRALYRGDGRTLRAEAFLPALRLFAGNGDAGGGGGTFSGDGAAAHLAGLSRPRGLAVGPDGSVYIADWLNARIRRVAPDGTITTFAGGGAPASGNGDGGLATDAELGGPTHVAFGPDGSLYISDAGDGRIRRVAANGTITTFAGGGTPADGLGDGSPATKAKLDQPSGTAVGANGIVYVADTNHDRVRAIGPDGIITTLAGGGAPSADHGDGDMGPDAVLEAPLDVLALDDGSVLIADSGHDRIRRVDASGEMSTFAGSGVAGYAGDGGLATAASIGSPTALAIDASDGRVLVAQDSGNVVRAIDSEGIITTLAGTGNAGYSGDEGPPAAATFRDPQGLAVGPDHKVYVSDTNNYRVRVIDSAMPGFSTTDLIVPSSEGAELYHFDSSGRHLRTLDALTGADVATFAYNSQGLLMSITDVHGNATAIDRDGTGVPTAIVSPFGQRTKLTINSLGRLTAVENPAAESVAMTYVGDGLLETFTTASGTSTFTYDSAGRLIADDGPGPGAIALNRTEIARGHRVTVTSPAGRATTYEAENLSSGSVRRTVTRPWGGVTRAVARLDGRVELTSEDGTKVASTLGPDPRFGMMTPLPTSMTTTTPGGRQVAMTFARSVTLSDPTDPLTLTAQSDTVTSNNKTVTRAYDGVTDTLTTTSAEGRQGSVALNDKGSVISVSAGGLAPVSFTYDLRGRVEAITQGSGAGARVTTMTYNADGFVEGVTDPRNDTTTFSSYDGVGRVKETTLADTNNIGFSYDAAGNLSALTPPGRGAHGFDHDTRGLLERYAPPALSVGATDTTYTYTDDKLIDSMTLPSGQVVDHQYDAGGRLDAVGFSRGVIDYAYSGSTAKLASITAPGGIGLSYSFDGPLLTGVSATGDAPVSVDYGYDADLRVSSRTRNGADATSYSYDKDGLLTAAGALSLKWDATNALLSSTSVGSVASSHAYNNFGEPASDNATYTDAATSTTTRLYEASYDSRDQLGRITSKTETINGVASVYDYTYDKRGRLIDVTKDAVAYRAYTYDANGNRLTASEDGGPAVSATYDAQDRLKTYGDSTYSYNPMGQLVSKTTGSQTTTYTYDELGNLTKVELPNKIIDYVVDGLGRRAANKIDGTVTNRFVYGQGIQPIAELNDSGGIKSQFVYAGKGHVPDLMIRNGTTYRFVTDQVGSVRMVVNSSTGEIAQQIDYDPFGQVVSDSSPGFQPFGFAGGLHERDTGLVRFGARDYDPAIGRWTAKDPMRFEGGDPNLYAYVGNNPVNFIDPTGLFLSALAGWIGTAAACVRAVAGWVGDNAEELLTVAGYVASGVALVAFVAGTGGVGGALFISTVAAVGIASLDCTNVHGLDLGPSCWTSVGTAALTKFAPTIAWQAPLRMASRMGKRAATVGLSYLSSVASPITTEVVAP